MVCFGCFHLAVLHSFHVMASIRSSIMSFGAVSHTMHLLCGLFLVLFLWLCLSLALSALNSLEMKKTPNPSFNTDGLQGALASRIFAPCAAG